MGLKDIDECFEPAASHGYDGAGALLACHTESVAC